MHAIASALVALLALLQLQLPAPSGYVNDFAHVLSAETKARIERIAQQVRDKSGGAIAVVTLPDLGGRDVGDIALQIGREWKVGSNAAVGARTRNTGVIILVVPKETSADRAGHVSIQTGQGSEAFITDAEAGDIRREAVPLFQQRDYDGAIQLISVRVAERFAREFSFALDSGTDAVPDLPPLPGDGYGGGAPRRRGGINPLVALVVFFVLLSVLGSMGRRRRGCGGCIPIVLPFGGGGGGGGGSWGGGGWGGGGGFGGGGGGGFGGFGGGGGFSGGGSSGSW